MYTLVSPSNLTRYWVPEEHWGHAIVLGPLLALHDAQRNQRLRGEFERAFRWEWSDRRAVVEAFEVIWNMTGRWRARRAVTFAPKALAAKANTVVPKLAVWLNRRQITCLRDVAALSRPQYCACVGRIHDAVREISSVRRTSSVEPVLGSKVLHHYFPSVVPVFDRALVRHGILRLESFRSWLAARPERWLVYGDQAAAGGAPMLDFHRYFAFSAAALRATPAAVLTRVRHRFGSGFADVAPGRMQKDRASLLWRLDAKLVEYSLLGAAYEEGLL